MRRAQQRACIEERYIENKNIEKESIFISRQNNKNEFIDQLKTSLKENFSVEKLDTIIFTANKYLKGYNIDKDPNYINESTEIEPSYININREDIQSYIDWCESKNLSSRTIERYKGAITFVSNFFNKALRELTSNEIKIYLSTRLQNSCGESVNNERVMLNGFYLYLYASKRILKNPMYNIRKMKFIKHQREPLTQMELEKLRLSCNTYFERAIIETLYSTGVRVGEFIHINLADIDFDINMVHITHPGKGGYTRDTVLSTVAILYIGLYLQYERKDDNVWLFSNPHNSDTRITINHVQGLCRELKVKAQIMKPITPHILRHTMATHGINSNIPIDELALLLGHNNLETTRIYAKRTITKIKESFQKINL